MFKQIFAAPVSWIYGMVVNIRHKLFDWGILKSEEFDIPIICVGNLTVGGTGKTPLTEFLINHFSKEYNVAVLSRGYKRKTRGFVIATNEISYLKIGDEPKQIKMKFPNIPLAVCENRVMGIKILRKIHPEINLIILDDSFQHRYVEPWVNILLMSYRNPVYKDKFLPLGTLRDSLSQLPRANFIIATKCPDDIKPIDQRVMLKSLDIYPYQKLYFSMVTPGELIPIFPDQEQRIPIPGQNVIAMAAIANPTPFLEELSKKYNVVKTMLYPDHYSYRVRDIAKIKKALSEVPKNTIIVVTEKDAVKLTNRKKIPLSIQKRLYYAPINVTFMDNGEIEFLRQLEQYVITNQKYTILHPE